jgi:hypothetical protein
MRSDPRACLLFLCAACGRSAPAPVGPAPVDDPVAAGTPLRFTGEVVLSGALARKTDGAVLVSVRPVGQTKAIWRRSYEIADPWWTVGPRERSLPFGLSPLDTLVEPPAQLSQVMEVVARYDPDGNADTDEPGDVEVVARARTGATDLVLVLGRPPADLRPGPDFSRTTGELASPIQHPR